MAFLGRTCLDMVDHEKLKNVTVISKKFMELEAWRALTTTFMGYQSVVNLYTSWCVMHELKNGEGHTKSGTQEPNKNLDEPHCEEEKLSVSWTFVGYWLPVRPSMIHSDNESNNRMMEHTLQETPILEG